MRSRESLDNLHPKALITRADVAFIAGVSVKTVTSWAQDTKVKPPFPDEREAKNPPKNCTQQKWYQISEVLDWLCLTGRTECGLTDGLLDIEGAAEGFGVSVETILVWRRRKLFPEPDLILARTPWWNPATLKEWTGRPSGNNGGGGNRSGRRKFVPPPGVKVKATPKSPITRAAKKAGVLPMKPKQGTSK